jgi:hypothetical protein
MCAVSEQGTVGNVTVSTKPTEYGGEVDSTKRQCSSIAQTTHSRWSLLMLSHNGKLGNARWYKGRALGVVPLLTLTPLAPNPHRTPDLPINSQ